MALSFLSSDGIINKLIVLLGGEPFLLNMKPQYFPMVYTLINIWRNFGWGSILYLSSMASIDTALYEAMIDKPQNRRYNGNVGGSCFLFPLFTAAQVSIN